MIFGINEKSVILTHTTYCCFCYKYTCATSDWFCGPGPQIISQNSFYQHVSQFNLKLELHRLFYCKVQYLTVFSIIDSSLLILFVVLLVVLPMCVCSLVGLSCKDILHYHKAKCCSLIINLLLTCSSCKPSIKYVHLGSHSCHGIQYIVKGSTNI